MEEGTDKVVANWNIEPILLSDNDKKLREVIRRLELLIINIYSLKSVDTKAKVNQLNVAKEGK